MSKRATLRRILTIIVFYREDEVEVEHVGLP